MRLCTAFPRLWRCSQILIACAATYFVLLSSSDAGANPSAHLRFIFLTPFVNYDFFEPIKKGMADAARSLGVEATFAGTRDGDVRALSQKVREAMDHYDGVAVNIVNSAGLRDAIAQVVNAGYL